MAFAVHGQFLGQQGISSGITLPRQPSSKPVVQCSWNARNSQGVRRAQAESVRNRFSTAAEAAAPAAVVEETGFRPGDVRRVTTLDEYERQFESARINSQLLVVEFTKEALPNSERNHQALVELTDATRDVIFLRVMADKSPELKELAVNTGVTQIPSYIFYRGGRKVHEGAGMNPDKLREQVLYYGEPEYPVHQLETAQAFHDLLQAESASGRLVVVKTTLNFCGPCAKVYQTVLQLSHKMAGEVVFARLFGDRDESTKSLLTELKIVEVPTFLFYRNNVLLGTYVGSGRGELVGEVLRHQGVQVT